MHDNNCTSEIRSWIQNKNAQMGNQNRVYGTFGRPISLFQRNKHKKAQTWVCHFVTDHKILLLLVLPQLCNSSLVCTVKSSQQCKRGNKTNTVANFNNLWGCSGARQDNRRLNNGQLFLFLAHKKKHVAKTCTKSCVRTRIDERWVDLVYIRDRFY